MKHASLLLNLVLLLAVGFLYYKVLGDNKPATKNTGTSPVSASESSTASKNAGSLIAYVELDSLNEQITYIKSRRNQFESQQKAIETEWQSGYRGLENKKNNFIKSKGQSATQQEIENMQNELYQQQQQIDARKQNQTQDLSEKSLRFLEEIQEQLKDFLTEYNKSKNYQYIFTTGTGMDYMIFKDSTLNITADVVAGMNEKLAKGKN